MKDLFEQKIKVKNIRDVIHFKDYEGADCDYEAGEKKNILLLFPCFYSFFFVFYHILLF